MLDERGLNGMISGSVRKAFDRGDRCAVVRRGDREAGVDRLGRSVVAVNEHRAGSALTALARGLRPREMELVAQYGEERRVGGGGNVAGTAVHGQAHGSDDTGVRVP